MCNHDLVAFMFMTHRSVFVDYMSYHYLLLVIFVSTFIPLLNRLALRPS